MAVVAIELVLQDRAGVFQGDDLVQEARADDAILEPAIGSFDFAFGLREEGIGHIDTQDTHRHAPLGIDIIGLEDMLAPDAVSSLDEAEDSQGVDVVAQGDAVGLHQGLGGLKVGASGLFGEEISEQQLAAEVVDGGDQRPFLLGKRGP